MTPDVEMQNALSQHYSVALYSGIPPNNGYRYDRTQENTPAVDYPRLLRLTAANGGQDKILVYWGQLESGSENEVTKVVSRYRLLAACCRMKPSICVSYCVSRLLTLPAAAGQPLRHPCLTVAASAGAIIVMQKMPNRLWRSSLRPIRQPQKKFISGLPSSQFPMS